MELLTNRYRRDPNAMVHSAYVGVAPGFRTVTRITQVNRNEDRFATSRIYGVGLPRGASGKAATIILGGMETTLDEVEYMLEGIREKKFTPQRSPSDIARMCQLVAERRNAKIKYWRKNPSEAPKRRASPVLHLPVGFRMAQTPIPGFKIAMKV